MIRSCLTALVFLSLIPAAARATIIYVSDSRSVSTSWSYSDSEEGSGGNGDAQHAPVPGVSWTSSWTAPSLVSSLSPTGITLDLTVRRALSYLQRTHVHLDIYRTISYYGPQDYASARISFQVTEPTSSAWMRDGVEWTQDLFPGTTYLIDERLEHAVNTGPDFVTRSFSMRLVPEPGTAVLVALGLVAAGLRSTHRERQHKTPPTTAETPARRR